MIPFVLEVLLLLPSSYLSRYIYRRPITALQQQLGDLVRSSMVLIDCLFYFMKTSTSKYQVVPIFVLGLTIRVRDGQILNRNEHCILFCSKSVHPADSPSFLTPHVTSDVTAKTSTTSIKTTPSSATPQYLSMLTQKIHSKT